MGQSLGKDSEVKEIDTDKDLVIGKELGRGAVGVVVEAFWKTGGLNVAVKKLSADVDDLTLGEFRREIAVHSSIAHQNVVRIFAACSKPPTCYLVMELCRGGALSFILADKNRQISWDIRIGFAIDVAKGLVYLHANKVIHRDIKSDNILLSSQDLTQAIAKIADLGASTIKAHKTRRMTGNVGTVQWMAPEVMQKKQTYSHEADVYSYGMFLWELAMRQVPFDSMSMFSIPDYVSKGGRPPLPLPHTCSGHILRLMTKCWAQDAYKRPHMRSVLRRLGVARSELLQQSEASLILFDFVVAGDLEGVQRTLSEAEQAHHETAASTLRRSDKNVPTLSPSSSCLALDINMRNVHGLTPLLAAVVHGHRNLIKPLIKAGADANALVYGRSALRLAIERGDIWCAVELLENGAHNLWRQSQMRWTHDLEEDFDDRHGFALDSTDDMHETLLMCVLRNMYGERCVLFGAVLIVAMEAACESRKQLQEGKYQPDDDEEELTLAVSTSTFRIRDRNTPLSPTLRQCSELIDVSLLPDIAQWLFSSSDALLSRWVAVDASSKNAVEQYEALVQLCSRAFRSGTSLQVDRFSVLALSNYINARDRRGRTAVHILCMQEEFEDDSLDEQSDLLRGTSFSSTSSHHSLIDTHHSELALAGNKKNDSNNNNSNNGDKNDKTNNLLKSGAIRAASSRSRSPPRLGRAKSSASGMLRAMSPPRRVSARSSHNLTLLASDGDAASSSTSSPRGIVGVIPRTNSLGRTSGTDTDDFSSEFLIDSDTSRPARRRSSACMRAPPPARPAPPPPLSAHSNRPVSLDEDSLDVDSSDGASLNSSMATLPMKPPARRWPANTLRSMSFDADASPSPPPSPSTPAPSGQRFATMRVPESPTPYLPSSELRRNSNKAGSAIIAPGQPRRPTDGGLRTMSTSPPPSPMPASSPPSDSPLTQRASRPQSRRDSTQRQDAAKPPTRLSSFGQVRVELLQALVQLGADTAVRDCSNSTPLMFAIDANNVRLSLALLEPSVYQHANSTLLTPAPFVLHQFVNFSNDFGETPLLIAARRGQSAIVAALLRIQPLPKIEVADRKSITTLHHAIRSKNVDCLKLLLSAGADPTRCTSRAPPDYIAYLKKMQTQTAKQRSARRSKESSVLSRFNLSPLHVAVLAKNTQAAMMLLQDKRVVINAVCDEGWTPLHMAIELQSIEMLHALLKHEANPDFKISDGSVVPRMTPRAFAEHRGATFLLNLINEHLPPPPPVPPSPTTDECVAPPRNGVPKLKDLSSRPLSPRSRTRPSDGRLRLVSPRHRDSGSHRVVSPRHHSTDQSDSFDRSPRRSAGSALSPRVRRRSGSRGTRESPRSPRKRAGSHSNNVLPLSPLTSPGRTTPNTSRRELVSSGGRIVGSPATRRHLRQELKKSSFTAPNSPRDVRRCSSAIAGSTHSRDLNRSLKEAIRLRNGSNTNDDDDDEDNDEVRDSSESDDQYTLRECGESDVATADVVVRARGMLGGEQVTLGNSKHSRLSIWLESVSKDSDAVLSAARRLVNQLRHASIAAPLAFCASPQRALLVWPTYLASLDAYLLAPPHDAGGDDDDDDDSDATDDTDDAKTPRSLNFVSATTQPFRLPLIVRILIAKEIAEGVAFLHHHNIVHTSLTPRAVMISTAFRAKLVDVLQPCDNNNVVSYSVSDAVYAAPEQLFNPNIPSSSNIYGCGVIMYELLMCKLAFDGESIRKLDLNSKINLDKCAPVLQRTLRACFLTDPDLRPSARSLAKRCALLAQSDHRPALAIDAHDVKSLKSGRHWLKQRARRVEKENDSYSWFLAASVSPTRTDRRRRSKSFNSSPLPHVPPPPPDSTPLKPDYIRAPDEADVLLFCSVCEMQPATCKLHVNGKLAGFCGTCVVEREEFKKRSVYAVSCCFHNDFPEARQALKELLDMSPEDPTTHYNMACVESRLGVLDGALASLCRALECGYSNFKQIHKDTDLAQLRKHPNFAVLMEQFESKKSSSAKKAFRKSTKTLKNVHKHLITTTKADGTPAQATPSDQSRRNPRRASFDFDSIIGDATTSGSDSSPSQTLVRSPLKPATHNKSK